LERTLSKGFLHARRSTNISQSVTSLPAQEEPIDWSIKQDRPATHYIWRTRGDEKVRPSHAANNGRVFAWDDPPETGHFGEDYGCRCMAEPFTPSVEEFSEIEMADAGGAKGIAWSTP
jgi:SPP1 gp7 family putative phage head morphogenesis protein